MEEPIKYKHVSVQDLLAVDISGLSNKGATKVGYRQKEFLESPIIVGRERNIVFPSGEKQKGYFALVDLDNIYASHDEETFKHVEGYPVDENGKNINDRNYETDKNAQENVRKVAKKLNPNILISTNATASSTPIISLDGVVVSGNNRVMGLKRAKNSFPLVYDAYKQVLLRELIEGGYGIGVKRKGYWDKDVCTEQNRIENYIEGKDILVKSGAFDDVKKYAYTLSELKKALEAGKEYRVDSLKGSRARGRSWDRQEWYNYFLDEKDYMDNPDYKVLTTEEIIEQIEKDMAEGRITKSSAFSYAEKSQFKDEKMSFKNPVLVRINVDFPEYTVEELAKYNAPRMKEKSKEDIERLEGEKTLKPSEVEEKQKNDVSLQVRSETSAQEDSDSSNKTEPNDTITKALKYL